MAFKDGDDVYFELEPFAMNSGDDDPFHSKRHLKQVNEDLPIGDDKWIERMCRQDADEYLSLIQKKGKISRSPICSREILKATGKDDTRDDFGNRDKRKASRIHAAIGNNKIRRDKDANFGRLSISERPIQNEVDKVDPIFLPGESLNHCYPQTWINSNNASSTESSQDHTSDKRSAYYGSSTDSSGSKVESNESHNLAQRNKYYVSSTDSSGSHADRSESGTSDGRNKYDVRSTESSRNRLSASGNKYISSSDSSWSSISTTSANSSMGRQAMDRRQQCRKPIDPPSASKKIIFDDIADFNAKMENTTAERELGNFLEPTGKYANPERGLWKMLLGRQWEQAKHRVRLHPEEARQKMKLPTNSTDVLNEEELQKMEEEESICIPSAFPLHVVCTLRPLPPTELLEDLINAYPEACQQFEESSGLLPVHMAANLQKVVQFHKPSRGLWANEEDTISKELPTRTIFTTIDGVASEESKQTGGNKMKEYKVDCANHESVIKLLLTSYPESISVRETANGMTPLHIAASTARAENGIVSPVVSNVLNTLMAKSSFDAVHFKKDKNGMTPYDWAWQNVDYFCPHCATENTAKGMNCDCSQSLSVSEKSLHPFLRNEIRNQLSDPPEPNIRLNAIKKDFAGRDQTKKAKSTMTKTSPPPKPNESCFQEIISRNDNVDKKQQNDGMISPIELNNIREYANTNMAFRKMACSKDALGSGKSATLHMKVCLSELVHPSIRGRRRGLGLNSKVVPNPFLEVFAAHRCGMCKSFYKSYPLHGSTEGIWEDVFLDLGLTRKQLRNGTNGAGYIEVGIRVMHIPEHGSKIKSIGSCQVSLETLEKEEEERQKLQNEIRNLNDIIGDGRMVDMALPEPKKHPVLKGFAVTGKLQIMSLTIE